MRRKTLGKHYYKSKKKRVKRRRTKTRKVGGGFSNIFRRPPTEIDDSLKQRIKNIKEAAEKLETLHATDEGKALFDKLLEGAKALSERTGSLNIDNYTINYLTEVKPHIDKLSKEGTKNMFHIFNSALTFLAEIRIDKKEVISPLTVEEKTLYEAATSHISTIIRDSNIANIDLTYYDLN